ncbi:tRNA (guanosine(46)-N7)-methyltransferase TrmB [Prosthecochloris sp. ZM]|uniref:tRNA (guanosine(46)-N7)-methyltransferase TrmB n=1 Tax=Prosthecochloris sp. ZM TaxID=2283143 RepID=UPI000DF865D4|nr:tRNA (guanosine(46)-N7)-methyltransferase TrmB [Prosthecochloris sp. ZM]RDD30460.1 tRNA (guanosine(46)-N7)-methyltransferase TrmB [Prosthecochloris sp. ZM]
MFIDTRDLLSEKENLTEDNLQDTREIEVEIGFGDGDYLIRRASECPEKMFIGIEKKTSLVTKVSKKAESLNLSNIRILQSCAEEAFSDHFSTASISRVYALFPDPWPKKKHIKNRLFSSPYLRLLNNRLLLGSEAMIVTDSEAYHKWILKQTPDTGFDVENDTIPPQFDTKFERKWVEQEFKSFFRIILRKIEHIDT